MKTDPRRVHRLRVPLLVAVAVVLLVPPATAATTATRAVPTASTEVATGVEPIEPVDVSWLSDRLVELTFANPRLDPPLARTKVRILVPAAFETSGERYPVVLLLHGIGDTSSAWTSNQDGYPVTLETFTADKDVIVVMPDGGKNRDAGWYTDWYNDGAFGSPQWATYHLVQLLDYVDRSFPTRTDRNGRVVAGLSMGGFGAMSYAARHPDLFAGAFSFSGALDNQAIGFVVDDAIWGPRATQEVRHRGHNPVDLAENLRDTKVWFRIGMGIPGGPGPKDNQSVALEAALWPTNESFANALDAAGVEYSYEVYPMGGHNWYHWQDGFRRAWPAMKGVFDSADGAPASFDYKSIEPRFSIWGWDVIVERAATEFLDLDDVSTSGFAVSGSGSVDFTTPASYQPGTTYQIRSTTSTGAVNTSFVPVGNDRRLRFTVVLGPPHAEQQYTAEGRLAALAPGYAQVADVRIERATCSGRAGERANAAPPVCARDSQR